MSKYIQMEGLRKSILDLNRKEFLEKCTAEHILKLIVNLPTIDIVRCKDCKRKYVTGTTTQYYVCDFMDAQYDENGFCHHGERVDEA